MESIAGKNHPVATNFQLLKILAPLEQLLVGACGAPNPAAGERDKREVIDFLNPIQALSVLFRF